MPALWNHTVTEKIHFEVIMKKSANE
jgi:hypothetical protein